MIPDTTWFVFSISLPPEESQPALEGIPLTENFAWSSPAKVTVPEMSPNIDRPLTITMSPVARATELSNEIVITFEALMPTFDPPMVLIRKTGSGTVGADTTV